MDNSHNAPQNPPMPETTKRATKRRKRPFRMKGWDTNTSMRQPNPIGQIYADVTDPNKPYLLARIADEDTEKRLNRKTNTAPSTSVRHGGMQFIW